MTKNKIDLKENKGDTTFSSDIFGGIFKDIIKKYKNETARQHLIRAIFEIWKKKYPQEMRAANKEIERTREVQKNKFGANKESDQRLLFRIPESLWNRIDGSFRKEAIMKLVYGPGVDIEKVPEFLKEEGEELWFMKNFPEFVVPEKY